MRAAPCEKAHGGTHLIDASEAASAFTPARSTGNRALTVLKVGKADSPRG